ncbi:hypothetical protein Ppb6_03495 [Photorhabdus australis subsp. thailandensis]|uniref:DUF4431 domain-containing protein n=1 Tax=Photorhabdus australis subsp. thailandensis TaxID=2805096 RepID=A0A1C0U042_9GAMM|nr:DUF4431 domain-containing protein [Photorhabdus australis]OCQ51274.1 hypothetical protein Ppb6_03495 [Photorhabdus australis subsp. thailandensis]
MLKKIAVIFLLVSASAHSASFDCAKATSKAEMLICATPELSQADDNLYVDYLSAKQSTDSSADFKVLTKQNWKLREKCTTVKCLQDWYRRSSEMYRQIAANTTENCYKEGQKIILAGTLLRITYPGPPNYESVENGDTPETYWVLQPDNPIKCAKGAPDWGDRNFMQLVVPSDFYDVYRSLLGHRVNVTGKIMYAVSGHHHTPLMIDSQRIDAAS